jgi:16S rRNA processing protein RimM
MLQKLLLKKRLPPLQNLYRLKSLNRNKLFQAFPMQKIDFYYLGKILKTYGNKGQLMVQLEVDEPEKYLKLESVYLDVYGERIPFFITAVELKAGKSAVFSFADVFSADEAVEYTGKEMFLPLDTLPALSGKQFYFHEVEGFEVTDTRYGELGRIESVLDLNHQCLFQIRRGEKEILIPVVDEIILELDRENKKLLIEAPEGLIDIYL